MILPPSESSLYVLFVFVFTDADCHQISMQTDATSAVVSVNLHKMLAEVPTGAQGDVAISTGLSESLTSSEFWTKTVHKKNQSYLTRSTEALFYPCS